MAYPQSLGRWRVTGFSSSVGSQFSVVWLLTPPHRNMGNDHLATDIASSRHNSIHPQSHACCGASEPPSNGVMTIGRCKHHWLPLWRCRESDQRYLTAEVKSLKTPSHPSFTKSILATKPKRLWSVHWRLYLFSLSTHLCASEFLLWPFANQQDSQLVY